MLEDICDSTLPNLEAVKAENSSEVRPQEAVLITGALQLTLIDEILDLAKVESRQMPLSQEPLSEN